SMCNLFLSLDPPGSKYALVVLSNRDEAIARPTAEAAWRDGILSGIDLQDPLNGTWFGIDVKGKIGVLLSITQLKEDKKTISGAIVKGFLNSDQTGVAYCDSLVPSASEYNGFTFVAIDRPMGDYSMHSFTNALVEDLETKHWTKGTHVVGNCPPHTTYRKMERGKGLLDDVLSGIGEETTPEEIAESLFEIGRDRVQCWPDEQLASQVNKIYGSALSSIFIRFGDPSLYGTRCQTALIIDKDGHVFLRERRLLSIDNVGKEKWESSDFTFTVP
ncbi:hypothetical protein PFISCL1PPCAC_22749, partial [Pristionchus fissidentatus]